MKKLEFAAANKQKQAKASKGSDTVASDEIEKKKPKKSPKKTKKED
jgi:hypothetical protein